MAMDTPPATKCRGDKSWRFFTKRSAVCLFVCLFVMRRDDDYTDRHGHRHRPPAETTKLHADWRFEYKINLNPAIWARVVFRSTAPCVRAYRPNVLEVPTPSR